MSDRAPPSRAELEVGRIMADVALKRAQMQWEPWEAMAAAFGAGATMASAMLALAVCLISHLH